MQGTIDTALLISTILPCAWVFGMLIYMFVTWEDA